MAKPTKDQQVQQKYLQLQQLQQQMDQTSQQLEMLAQQCNEVEVSKDALEQLQKTPKNNETLATIAPGIFVKTALKDNQKLIVNIGANTTVEKTVPQVIKMLEEQKEELNKNMTQLDTILQTLTQQAMKLYQEIETQ